MMIVQTYMIQGLKIGISQPLQFCLLHHKLNDSDSWITKLMTILEFDNSPLTT